MNDIRQEHRVRITPQSVEIDGKPLITTAHGTALLTELYRSRVNDYPKFFKMDELSRLGFLASELLLKAAGERPLSDETTASAEGRAVILFGRSGSVANDCKYQQTIAPADYFPSPSVFVYTLPNIVTGEIAIRNHYHGETAFYLMDRRDEQLISDTIRATLLVPGTTSALCGWLDCMDEDTFEADLWLYVRE